MKKKIKPIIKVSKKMENVTNETAVVERQVAVVADYLELLDKQDEEACMNYLVACFGDPTSDDLDKEGFEAFSMEVAAARDAELKVEAVEEVVKDEAVAE
jgi:hypothetical protein